MYGTRHKCPAPESFTDNLCLAYCVSVPLMHNREVAGKGGPKRKGETEMNTATKCKRHTWATVAGTLWAAPAVGPTAVRFEDRCAKCGALSSCIVRHPGPRGRIERTVEE